MSLTPEYQAIRKQAWEEKRQANLSTCLSAGATAVPQHATLHEYLFTPERVTMLFENGEVRRIHLNAEGQLQIDNVMTDPTIFAKPYVYTRRYKRSSLPLEEPVCVHNNRDNGDTVDLTPPPEE